VPASIETPKPLRGPAASVARALEAIQPLSHMWRDGLTVIALDSRLPNRPPEYLTLDEAASGGAVEVHEAAAQEVPSVEAKTGPSPVLILGGDTIVGGAQNRIVNITILLKAAATTQIPVSCLELGRWNDGRRFTASRPVDHNLRRMVAEQVSHGSGSRGTSASFAADQGAIWQEIGQRQARAGLHSPTEALHDVYAREEADLAKFDRALPMPIGTCGVAIGLFDRLVGLDLFDSAETLERQWPRLVASAASALFDQQRMIEAGIVPVPRHRHLDSNALDRMLARARSALPDATVKPSVGEGSDVRFTAQRLLGSALVHERRAVHIALFRSA
jgi:hypothetical protein